MPSLIGSTLQPRQALRPVLLADAAVAVPAGRLAGGVDLVLAGGRLTAFVLGALEASLGLLAGGGAFLAFMPPAGESPATEALKTKGFEGFFKTVRDGAGQSRGGTEALDQAQRLFDGLRKAGRFAEAGQVFDGIVRGLGPSVLGTSGVDVARYAGRTMLAREDASRQRARGGPVPVARGASRNGAGSGTPASSTTSTATTNATNATTATTATGTTATKATGLASASDATPRRLAPSPSSPKWVEPPLAPPTEADTTHRPQPSRQDTAATAAAAKRDAEAHAQAQAQAAFMTELKKNSRNDQADDIERVRELIATKTPQGLRLELGDIERLLRTSGRGNIYAHDDTAPASLKHDPDYDQYDLHGWLALGKDLRFVAKEVQTYLHRLDAGAAKTKATIRHRPEANAAPPLAPANTPESPRSPPPPEPPEPPKAPWLPPESTAPPERRPELPGAVVSRPNSPEFGAEASKRQAERFEQARKKADEILETLSSPLLSRQTREKLLDDAIRDADPYVAFWLATRGRQVGVGTSASAGQRAEPGVSSADVKRLLTAIRTAPTEAALIGLAAGLDPALARRNDVRGGFVEQLAALRAGDAQGGRPRGTAESRPQVGETPQAEEKTQTSGPPPGHEGEGAPEPGRALSTGVIPSSRGAFKADPNPRDPIAELKRVVAAYDHRTPGADAQAVHEAYQAAIAAVQRLPRGPARVEYLQRLKAPDAGARADAIASGSPPSSPAVASVSPAAAPSSSDIAARIESTLKALPVGHTLTLGRLEPGLGLTHNRSIGRLHADIRFVRGKYMVTDKQSTNGTFFRFADGSGRWARIHGTVELDPGTRLRLGTQNEGVEFDLPHLVAPQAARPEPPSGNPPSRVVRALSQMLPGQSIELGRSNAAFGLENHPGVSRRHATVTLDPTRSYTTRNYILTDHSSRGTYYRDPGQRDWTRVRGQTTLPPGTEVRLGNEHDPSPCIFTLPPRPAGANAHGTGANPPNGGVQGSGRIRPLFEGLADNSPVPGALKDPSLIGLSVGQARRLQTHVEEGIELLKTGRFKEAYKHFENFNAAHAAGAFLDISRVLVVRESEFSDRDLLRKAFDYNATQSKYEPADRMITVTPLIPYDEVAIKALGREAEENYREYLQITALTAAEEWLHALQHAGGAPMSQAGAGIAAARSLAYDDETDVAVYLRSRGVEVPSNYWKRYAQRRPFESIDVPPAGEYHP